MQGTSSTKKNQKRSTITSTSSLESIDGYSVVLVFDLNLSMHFSVFHSSKFCHLSGTWFLYYPTSLVSSELNVRTMAKKLRMQTKQVVHRFSLFDCNLTEFNHSTKIQFILEKREHVNLTIYNLNGQEIKQLVDEEKQPGTYLVLWNAKNNPSGVYLCKIQMEKKVRTVKLLLQK